MEKKFIESLYSGKNSKLKLWRERYTKTEYPYKVLFNLVYESLVIEEMWDEILDCFAGHQKRLTDFNSAHKHIMDRSDIIARTSIIPVVPTEYNSRVALTGYNLALLRERVTKAQSGNNSDLQEIEYAYTFYTCGIELIYAWAAMGLLGANQESAFFQLSGFVFGGIDYSSLNEVITYFGQATGHNYKPLPKLF